MTPIQNAVTPGADATHEELRECCALLAIANAELKAELRKADGLLEAVKLAYRKHNMNDYSIGWDELENSLCNAICEAIGDDGFVKFVDGVKDVK